MPRWVRIWLGVLVLLSASASRLVGQEPYWCDSCDEERGQHTQSCPERPRPAERPRPDAPKRSPRPGRVLFQEALAAGAAGRLEEAVGLYRAALVHDPSLVSAWHNLGAALWRLERWAEAERAYEEAFARRPSPRVERSLGRLREVWRERERKSRRRTLWARARERYAEGDLAGARESLEEVRPRDAPLWRFLARVLTRAGQLREAELATREAAALERDPEAREELWRAEEELWRRQRRAEERARRRQLQARFAERVSAGDLLEAGRLLEAELSREPEPRWIFAGLGRLALERRPLRGAARAEWALRRALRLDAGRASTWTNLGVLYDRAGQERRALSCYRRALALDPALREIGARAAALGRAPLREASPRLLSLRAPSLLGRRRGERLPRLDLSPLRADLPQGTEASPELVIRREPGEEARAYQVQRGSPDATLSWLREQGSIREWPELEAPWQPSRGPSLEGAGGWRFGR